MYNTDNTHTDFSIGLFDAFEKFAQLHSLLMTFKLSHTTSEKELTEKTQKYMSKAQYNLLSSINGSSILTIQDNTDPEKLFLANMQTLMCAAIQRLIEVRDMLGPNGKVQQFARMLTGGSLKQKQKTRRLHRNGHYNSRKRYD